MITERYLKPYNGYEILKKIEKDVPVYYSETYKGKMIKTYSLNEMKNKIKEDIKKYNNKIDKQCKKNINYNKEWAREIKSLMRAFHIERYFFDVINNTINENPYLKDDGLYRMAHKKIMMLI